MATTYVVLRATGNNYGGDEHPEFYVVGEVDAANTTLARRAVAENSLTSEELDEGVTLIAVPARNWRAGMGHVKAETTRRIRST